MEHRVVSIPPKSHDFSYIGVGSMQATHNSLSLGQVHKIRPAFLSWQIADADIHFLVEDRLKPPYEPGADIGTTIEIKFPKFG